VPKPVSPVGARIRVIREKRDLTREQLAKKLRTNRLRIWRIETGSTRLEADDVPRFARALGVKPAELFT